MLEAVVFDFGGVILDIDYARTDRAMRTLLGVGSGVEYNKARQSPVFDQLEEGKITPDAFYKALAEAAGRPLTPAQIDEAWNAMLLDVPPARFDVIRRVASQYPTYLFSNTNAIHKAAFDKILERHLGPGGFDRLFQRAYYSHLFGDRKPHPATYTRLVNEIGHKAENTLFIDDSVQNIVGAREAGLQAYHLEGELLTDAGLAALLKLKSK